MTKNTINLKVNWFGKIYPENIFLNIQNRCQPTLYERNYHRMTYRNVWQRASTENN